MDKHPLYYIACVFGSLGSLGIAGLTGYCVYYVVVHSGVDWLVGSLFALLCASKVLHTEVKGMLED